MLQTDHKLFRTNAAVEFFVRDLVGELDVDDIFVKRMVPMVRSIYAVDVPRHRRETLMEIAMSSILRQAQYSDR